MVEQIIELLLTGDSANIQIALSVAKSQDLIQQSIECLEQQIIELDKERKLIVEEAPFLFSFFNSCGVLNRKHYIRFLKNAQ